MILFKMKHTKTGKIIDILEKENGMITKREPNGKINSVKEASIKRWYELYEEPEQPEEEIVIRANESISLHIEDEPGLTENPEIEDDNEEECNFTFEVEDSLNKKKEIELIIKIKEFGIKIHSVTYGKEHNSKGKNKSNKFYLNGNLVKELNYCGYKKAVEFLSINCIEGFSPEPLETKLNKIRQERNKNYL